MKPQLLDLADIRIDGNTQPRCGINTDLVAEYAEAYEAGANIPPAVVFFDGVAYWLADGFHRWHAAKKMGILAIKCEAHDGTVEDARWYSASANQTHGQRRTNADKAKAVQMALSHPNGVGLSDRQIAEHVGVSNTFVGKVRGTMEDDGQLSTVDNSIGSDGKSYPRKTNADNAVKAALSEVPDEEQDRVIAWATEKAEGAPIMAAGIRSAWDECREAEPEEEDDTEQDDEADEPEAPNQDAVAKDELRLAIDHWQAKWKKLSCVVACILEALATEKRGAV